MSDFRMTTLAEPCEKVHAGDSQQKQKSQNSQGNQQQRIVTNCRYCGTSHQARQCPAYDKFKKKTTTRWVTIKR